MFTKVRSQNTVHSSSVRHTIPSPTMMCPSIMNMSLLYSSVGTGYLPHNDQGVDVFCVNNGVVD